ATEIQSRDLQNSPRRYEFVDVGEPPVRRKPGECFQCTRKPLPVFFGGARRDITTLLPNDEIEIFMRWKDFHGKYVMHCHNVVHEDHAMMIRWDIVPPKKQAKEKLATQKHCPACGDGAPHE